MQISRAFDAVTIQKIKHSALLSLAGFAVAAIPLLLPGILELAKGNPVAVAFVAAVVPWIVNLIKQFLSGEPQQ